MPQKIEVYDFVDETFGKAVIRHNFRLPLFKNQMSISQNAKIGNLVNQTIRFLNKGNLKFERKHLLK